MAGLAQRPRGTAHPKASRSAATDSPAGLPALARTEGSTPAIFSRRAATNTERAIHANSSRWFGAWSLDEFKDVPVRVSDVAAADPVPGATRVMQQHGVARYLAR